MEILEENKEGKTETWIKKVYENNTIKFMDCP